MTIYYFEDEKDSFLEEIERFSVDYPVVCLPAGDIGAAIGEGNILLSKSCLNETTYSPIDLLREELVFEIKPLSVEKHISLGVEDTKEGDSPNPSYNHIRNMGRKSKKRNF